MSTIMLKDVLPEEAKNATEFLLEELSKIEGKAEIINGEIIEMPPTGFEPGNSAGNIFFSLKLYQKRIGKGIAISDNVGFLVNLPHRKSFSPDASFHLGKRTGMKFLEGAPIFAVEVRSENDYGQKAEEVIREKRMDYFAAGTEIVWDVDLLSEEVIKAYYRENPQEARVFKKGETADAEPILPDWRFAVDELFD
jgi:Uma2 family endonuclease